VPFAQHRVDQVGIHATLSKQAVDLLEKGSLLTEVQRTGKFRLPDPGGNCDGTFAG